MDRSAESIPPAYPASNYLAAVETVHPTIVGTVGTVGPTIVGTDQGQYSSTSTGHTTSVSSLLCYPIHTSTEYVYFT